jgi:probable HAF family extracellular repeat protein
MTASIRCLALLATALAASPSNSALAGHYRITMLQISGQTNVQAAAINDRGQVAGSIYGGQGIGPGFTVTKNTAVLVQGTQGFIAINDRGVALDSTANQQAYLLYDTQSGVLRTHDVETGGVFSPGGFNNVGQVVGTGSLRGKSQAYLIDGHKKVKLTYPGSKSSAAAAINDNGIVIGTYDDASGNQHCFSYQAGSYTNIDPGTTNYCQALFVSQDGSIGIRANGFGAGVLKGTSYTPINVPKSDSTTITGVGPGDEVVGYFAQNNNSEPQGFVYRANKYYTIDMPGAPGTFINGVNARGDLVGVAGVDGGFQSFVATCPVHQAPCTK